MTSTKLPFLHRNARSRQITSAEAREVFASEVARGVPNTILDQDYIEKVMP